VVSAKLIQLQRAAAAAVPTADLIDDAVAIQNRNLFGALVDFVRDRGAMPDRAVNALARLIRQSIRSRALLLGVDVGAVAPSTGFLFRERNGKPEAALLLPRHFSDNVREDLLWQLGSIANVGSHLKDLTEGRFGVDEMDAIETRARAYEAQCVRALLPLFQADGTVVRLAKADLELLQEFPEGLKSMPAELDYGRHLT
jgi:hypothetical protein